MKKHADYYTYVHQTPDGRVFYVGKGREDRAYVKRNRNPHWKNIVAQHGGSFEVCIMADGLDEKSAYQHEIELIASLRSFGEKLANATDGGDGGGRNKRMVCCADTGEIFSSVREAAAHIGATGALIACAIRGRRVHTAKGLRFFYVEHGFSPDEIAATAAAIRATPAPEPKKHRKPRSEAHRKKLSEINSGRRLSPETIEKSAAKRRGRVGALCHNSKPVLCVTTGVVFPSSLEAAEWAVSTGGAKDAARARRAILAGLSNGSGNSCGYKWAKATTSPGI